MRLMQILRVFVHLETIEKRLLTEDSEALLKGEDWIEVEEFLLSFAATVCNLEYNLEITLEEAIWRWMKNKYKETVKGAYHREGREGFEMTRMTS
ncbi:Hypothetical predicted protein [Olea europaea subsp. europaea]|uniref:Uncharacterized protein n=1 Tax=Olea europaea subsp. europaea TaxID=158383 RepID=A0A8S0S084_OLEEU|nr:Hypothetical predicted protein [Olea europaea subsp. europaea]